MKKLLSNLFFVLFFVGLGFGLSILYVYLSQDRQTTNATKTTYDLIQEGDDHYQEKRYSQALGLYQLVLQKEPDNLMARMRLGQLFQLKNRHLQAISEFELIVQADPDNVDALYRIGKIQVELRNFEEGESYLKQALEALDQNQTEKEAVHYQLGLAQLWLSKFAEALGNFQTALAINQENYPALFYSSLIIARDNLPQGLLGLRQIAELEITSPVIQHSQKAIQSLEKIEALDSELLQTMQMGVTYLEQDLPTLALDYFQTTLDKEPNYHSAHYYLGYTYFLTGDISRALQYLEASLELGSPPDALAYYYLAKVYSHQKDYKKAINMYERSVDAGADFVDLFVSLGQALRENQEFSKAARSYLRALRLDENLIKTRVSLISIYLYNLKDYTKAKEIATECTKRDPLLARCHDLLGWVLLENEELIEAEKSIRLALELDPELASAYYNLATLLEQKGLIDQARTNYQTALDLDFTGEIAPIADQALANLP